MSRITTVQLEEEGNFHVMWEIDVTAASHEETARRALEMQRNPSSTATVFDVFKWDETEPTRVNLESPEISEPVSFVTTNNHYAIL